MEKVFSKILNVSFGKIYFLIVLFFLISVQTLPDVIFWPSVNLDPSWVIGINIASIENMQFGKDVIFTFGPLGFMYLPSFFNYEMGVISVLFALFVHFLLLYSIFSIVKKMPLNLPDYLLLTVILIFAIPMTSIGFKLLFSIISLFYLSINDEKLSKYAWLINILICFLMAVATLLKFTGTVISFSLLFFMVVHYLYKKKYLYIPLLFAQYICSLLFLLIMTGQHISNFPAYLINSIEVSRGYNIAMAISGHDNEIYVGMCIAGLLFTAFIDSILKKKKDLIYFILLNSGFIFVSIKYGYVRHDGHVFYFFANMLFVLMIVAFILKAQSRKILQHTTFVIICVVLVFSYKQFPYLAKSRLTEKYNRMCSIVSIMKSSPEERERIFNDRKEDMKKTYALNENTLEFIDDKTMDIFQWEISLAYAYDMNWSPRPIFQSYSAYSQKLDSLNAQYFEKETSPEVLLYSFETVDFRYHLFDIPETFRTILEKYEPVLIDNNYLLLEKNDSVIPGSQEFISEYDGEIGESIPIPKIDEGFIFARIDMDYNLLGKIFNVIFKVPYAMIKMKSGEKEYDHRFIFPIAENGIFLSQYISNPEDMMKLWSEKPLNDLDSFTITVGRKSFYNKEIHVEFFEIVRK